MAFAYDHMMVVSSLPTAYDQMSERSRIDFLLSQLLKCWKAMPWPRATRKEGWKSVSGSGVVGSKM